MSIIDIKWQLLPNTLVYIFGGLSVFVVVGNALIFSDLGLLYNSLVGSAILFGIFWSIYQISGGRWIGGGDVRLLGMMGILLGWQKGLLAVVTASYLATIFVVILVVLSRYKKGMRISFGPFLLLGTYLAFLFGDLLIKAYINFSGL
jgi:leader peptidase (prepilin peptidase)/N-methyltransferase